MNRRCESPIGPCWHRGPYFASMGLRQPAKKFPLPDEISLWAEVHTPGDKATCSSIQTHSPISAIRFLSTSLSPLQSIGSGTVFIFAFHKSMANGSDRNLLISEMSQSAQKSSVPDYKSSHSAPNGADHQRGKDPPRQMLVRSGS